MYLVPLENFAQTWATQQVLFILFTFKTISNLQLKLCMNVILFTLVRTRPTRLFVLDQHACLDFYNASSLVLKQRSACR
jgi:hypothetical protein